MSPLNWPITLTRELDSSSALPGATGVETDPPGALPGLSPQESHALPRAPHSLHSLLRLLGLPASWPPRPGSSTHRHFRNRDLMWDEVGSEVLICLFGAKSRPEIWVPYIHGRFRWSGCGKNKPERSMGCRHPGVAGRMGVKGGNEVQG